MLLFLHNHWLLKNIGMAQNVWAKDNVLRRKMATCHLSKLGFPKWINMDGYSTRNDQNLRSAGSYNLTPSSKYDICDFHSFYNAISYDGSVILLPSQYLLLMVWWPSSQYRGLSNPTFHHLTHITHAKKKQSTATIVNWISKNITFWGWTLDMGPKIGLPPNHLFFS